MTKTSQKLLLLTLLILVTMACSDTSADSVPEIEAPQSDIISDRFDRKLIASVSDGQRGALSTVDVLPPYNNQVEIAPAGPSAFLREFFGQVFLVNQQESRIDLLNRVTLQPVRSYPIGQGTQPMDILVLNKRFALVSDFNSDHLHKLNLETGEVTPSIDLSVYSDTDGLPDVMMMEKVDNKVYIQLQRFDRNTLQETNGAIMAVVRLGFSTSAGDFSATLLPGISLQGKRPAFKMQVNKKKNRLYVAMPGVRMDFLDETGIEEIDLTTEQSLGFFITEGQLGGDMGPFVIIDDNRGFAVFHTSIVASTHLAHFRRGQSFGELRSTIDGWTDAIAYDERNRHIFYGEPSLSANTRSTEPGGSVFVYDARTAQPLSGAIGIGKPPVDFLISK